MTAAALIAAAALLAAPPLDSAARVKVKSVLEGLLLEAERATGLSLSFDSVSPSILETVSLRRLRALTPRGSTLLSAGRVILYYDLGALAKGDVVGAVKALRIEDASLDLDVAADRELLGRLARLVSGGPEGGSAVRLSISGRDIAIKVSDPRLGSAALSAREVTFEPRGEESEIGLSGDFRIDQRLADLGSIRGPLTVQGSLSRDFSRARLELGLAARGRDFELRTQRFEATYGEGRVDLRKVKDEAPLDAELGLDLRDGSLSAELTMEDYAPERSFRATGRYEALRPWLSTPYSGRLSLVAPGGDTSRLTYEARLSGSLPPGILPRRVGADIAAKGDLWRIEVERARVVDGADSFEYSGSFRFADLAPDGTLGLELSLMDGAMPLKASLRVFGEGGEYAVLADRMEAAGTLFRDVSAAAARRGNQVDFRASLLLPEASDPAPDLPPVRFSGEALPMAGASPLVRLEGSASWGRSPELDASVSLEAVDLAPLAGFLEALLGSRETASTLAGIRVGGEVFVSSDFARLSWSAPDLAVVSRSLPGAYALLSLSGNAESVSVRRAALSIGGISIKGQGSVDIEKGGVGFEARLSYLDVPYLLRGSFAGGALSLSGDYGIEASARREGESLVANLRAKDMPVPVAGARLLVSADAEGRYASPSEWAVDLASLAVLPTGQGLERVPKVSLAGSFGPKRGELWELAAEDKYSAVSGAGRLEYELSGEPSGRLVASLGSKASQEKYEIDLAYAKGGISGEVSFQDSPLKRIGPLPVLGGLDGKASISGTLADPALAFELQLRNGKYGDQSLAAKVSGRYEDGGLSISGAQASYLSHRLLLSPSSFSLRDGSASMALTYSGILGGEGMSFALSAEGRSSAKAPGPLAERLADYAVQGRFNDFKFFNVDEKVIPFSASLSRTGARLKAGTRQELEAGYDFDGHFAVNTRAPLPVRITATGRLSGNTIDATATDAEVDVSIFQFFFAPRDLEFLSGTAVGSLRVQGLVGDPEMSGSMVAKGLSLRVPGWIADPVGPCDLPLTVKGRSLEAELASVPVGKGRVAVKAQATLDRWTPTGLKATLRSAADSQVRMDAKLLGISVAGNADFSLDADFRGDTVFLKGDVALGKSTVLVSPEVWANTAAAQPPPEPGRLFLSVDMGVGFGRGAQVLFPSKDLPIVTGYADRGSALSIRYDQATNDLLLKGSVALRGGEVFYIQRNFFLKSARMAFNESIERFDPRVTLLAELRDRNDSGPVVITLSATNAPIASFQPRLSSDPPMTEAQIAALLGQNLLGMESENDLSLLNAAVSTSEFIPQFNVTKAFESRVREALGLDIFYLRTQVLQRLVIDLSAGGSASQDLVGSYLDQTSLYAGKYVGDSIFVYGTASIREDPLVRAIGLRLDSELGAELETPFGLVQWTLTPSSPESLFMRDQSISISWKLSY